MFQVFSLTFVAVFVALDIIGTLPLYVSMTDGLTEPDRKKVCNRSMLVAVIVAIVFMFIGEAVFGHLGIALYDFRIAGGLVLLLISLADLSGNAEVKSRASGQTGIVPLAVPLITGPAVLTTLILQASKAGYLITLGALLINYLIAWQVLFHSGIITRLIGKDGTVVISKIAALLLAAIAISMMRGGIFEAIQTFQH